MKFEINQEEIEEYLRRNNMCRACKEHGGYGVRGGNRRQLARPQQTITRGKLVQSSYCTV